MYTADMELNHLKTFVVVAEERNLTRAADRLYMTPPSVSAHIKALEDELGVILFIRKPQGMEITEHGEILRVKAEKILHSTREMLNLSKKLQVSLTGTTRIGLSATSSYQRAAKLISQMQKEHPDIELTFLASCTHKIIQGLKNHSMDAGYMFGPIDDEALAGHELDIADLVIIAPSTWKDKVAGADWKEIAALPWVGSSYYCPFQTALEKLFKKRKLAMNHVVWMDDEFNKCALVEEGIGMALLEKSEAEQAASNGRIFIWKTEPIKCKVSWVHLRNRSDDPLIAALTAQVLNVWGKA
ncbi:MAG TPA: LysR family transcriptional regulator [Anaerolineales bacterium]|nr:LysR family transcriptional regulator [Anaerolineales bacterium]HNA52989.1 LysR family transcriptional regulator [Anaerolineales bacterium]HNC89270.1 LysR family transcriptional regulator [Anaerolineales bacterium]HNF33287.1 LysR family transcriptional regulator [Anaerolineales bacterium]HNJ14568.1 LysR family transcriptional regulator [Anaerolineales bacterium]